jgi:hypothetical protein
MAFEYGGGIGGYNRVLMFRRFHHGVFLLLLMISISMIVWAALPNQHQNVVQSVSPAEMQISQPGQGNGRLSTPGRQVELQWPQRMRIGEDEAITLVFKPVVTDPGLPSQTVDYTNVYSSYNLMAEAQYDVAGISVTPANPTRKSMPDGQSVKFTWKVNTDQIGSYDGTVWLYLRFLPLTGGPASQVPIYIHEFKIQTSSLFGLSESRAYLLGGVGVVLALVVVYDDLVRWVGIKKRKIATKETRHTKDSIES